MDRTAKRAGGRDVRSLLAVAAVAVATLAVGMAGTEAPVAATPSSGAAASEATTAAVEPSALGTQPRNIAWARQIARRVHEPIPGGTELGTVDEGEAVALGAKLDAATSAASVIRAYLLEASPVRSRVQSLYRQVLGRDADPSGLAYWSSRISSGRLTYEDLLVTLAISNEVWTKAGAAPAGYVDWTYRHVLGRDADPSGRAFWIARLESGTSRDRFARSFLRSSERSRSVVRTGYRQFLARDADAGGLAHWAGKYAAGSIGEVDLAVSLLASSESRNAGCGYDPKYCLFPFPNDDFVEAPGTDHQRMAFKPEWLPANASGKHVDPTEWNRNVGYGLGQAIVLRVPGIDLEASGLAGLDDIGASLADDAPVVITKAGTGERVPYWAELDSQAGTGDQVLYIRPAIDYEPGTQYVVGMRDLKTASGDVIASPPAFDRERDAVLAEQPWLDPVDVVRKTFAAKTLTTELGWDVGDAYLFWTFTTGTTDDVTGRMLHIRDDALATLGEGGAPAFTVSSVTDDPRTGVAKRVEGTFEVPLYLTGTGQPGATFTNRANGLPTRNGTYVANFDCEIPTAATAETPSRATVYGHGLFGSLDEVRSGPQAAMVTGYDMTYCATDWIGMSDPDVLNAAAILQDLSTFDSLADRSQQGILNTVFLGRLLTSEQGFVSDPAFQDDGGAPLIDTAHLFYDGNSQGGVIGGAYVAVDPAVEAGVLGVAGMNYSTLLERSVDFDPFFTMMKGSYPDRVDQVVGLQLIQMLWDRGETNGYAAHLNATDHLPGTVAKRVLIHTAIGDHQVAPLTAEIEARTAGLPIHRPTYLDGRTHDVDPAWGLDAISYPSTGGGLVVWDSGADLAPLGNVPPRTGRDPHSDPRNSPKAQQQKSEFLRSGGMLVDVCDGAPCTTS